MDRQRRNVHPEFTKDDRGFHVEAWYLVDTEESKGEALIQISYNGEIVREFLFPSYKIWNIAAHFSDIVDGELSKDDKERGYGIAASTGLGGVRSYESRIEGGGEMIREAIEAAEQKHREEEKAFQQRIAASDRDRRENCDNAMGWLGSCRRARPADYACWLADFIEAGGQITHVYDYAMPCDWLVARISFTVSPLYGSASKCIIVPVGYDVEIGPLGAGHNDIFWHEGPCASGSVPLYSDIADILKEES